MAVTSIDIALPADLFDFDTIRSAALRAAIVDRRPGMNETAHALNMIVDRVDTFMAVHPIDHAVCADEAINRGLRLTAQHFRFWANQRIAAEQLGREGMIAKIWHAYLNHGSGRA